MNVYIGSAGKLFVVATPIGNMEDITFRAVRILAFVEMVVAENLRITERLLNYHNVKTKLLSMNEHNEDRQIPKILSKISSGFNVALVSSAGTPLISDPGFRLIKRVITSNIDVIPIPGASAIISSLSVAGLPTDKFTFFGFPAKKKEKRFKQLIRMASEKKTLIFYESPRRIVTLLEEVIEVMGDRYAVLSREMTKVHEEFIRGKISLILNKLKNRDKVKGECTLLISGSEIAKKPACISTFSKNDLIKTIKNCLDDGFTTLDLSKLISRRYGLAKSEAYGMILDVRRGLNH